MSVRRKISLLAMAAALCFAWAAPSFAFAQGRASGMVTNVQGTPLSGIPITFGRWDGQYFRWVAWKSTDETGRYSADLEDGTYRVAINGLSNAHPEYEWYFYGGGVAISSGADVVVNGADVPSLDATIKAYPVAQGTVREMPTGAAHKTAWVDACVLDQASGRWVETGMSAATEADGSWKIRLTPGRYRFHVSAGEKYDPYWLPDVVSAAEADEYAVDWDQNVNAGTSDLWRWTHLTGAVTMGSFGTTWATPPRLELWRQDAEGQWQLDNGNWQGQFTGYGFSAWGSRSGIYRLVVKSSEPAFADIGYPAGTSLETAADIEIGRGSAEDFTFRMKPVAGSVSGSVQILPDPLPAAGRLVELRWAHQPTSAFDGTLVATTTTDATGAFRFDGVEATPEYWMTTWHSAGYSVRVYDPTGLCVDITAGVFPETPLIVSPGTDTGLRLGVTRSVRILGALREQGTGRPVVTDGVYFVRMSDGSPSWVPLDISATGEFASNPMPAASYDPASTGVEYWAPTLTDPTGQWAFTDASGQMFTTTPGRETNVTLEVRRLAWPQLTIEASSSVGAGSVFYVTGSFTQPSGQSIYNRTLSLEASSDNGANWRRVASPTTPGWGKWSVAQVSNSNVRYRVRFLGEPQYFPMTSGSRSVAIVPKLSAPRLSSAAHGRDVRLTGSLVPRHAPNSLCVRVIGQQKVGGVWKLRFDRKAKAIGRGTSEFSLTVRLATKGRWRFQAIHNSDASNARAQSSWNEYRVR